MKGKGIWEPIKKYIVFIHMDNIKDDINVLRKLLNSPLFLNKYPTINRVWVEKYGDQIDIVLSIDGPSDEYWPIKDEIKSFVWTLVKMAGVKTRYNFYP